MIVKKTAPDFIPAPAGSHLGRCIKVVDLGTQTSDIYEPTARVFIEFELCSEMSQKNGQNGKPMPMTVFKEYPCYLSKTSKLRIMLEGWAGKELTKEQLDGGYDLFSILGKACMVNIVHVTTGKGIVRADISGVSSLPKMPDGKQMPCPKAVHPLVKFDITDGRNEAFQSLPPFVKLKIEKSVEWTTPTPARAHADENGRVIDESDVPEPESIEVPF